MFPALQGHKAPWGVCGIQALPLAIVESRGGGATERGTCRGVCAPAPTQEQCSALPGGPSWAWVLPGDGIHPEDEHGLLGP